MKSMPLKFPKICGRCDKNHDSVPESHKVSVAAIPGFYFDCACGSTLLISFENVGFEQAIESLLSVLTDDGQFQR